MGRAIRGQGGHGEGHRGPRGARGAGSPPIPMLCYALLSPCYAPAPALQDSAQFDDEAVRMYRRYVEQVRAWGTAPEGGRG